MDVTLDESPTSRRSIPELREQFIKIKDKIVKGEYTIVIETGKSKVWKIFGKVENSGSVISDVVACKNCNSAFKFTNSTSNLVKHKCYKNLKNRSEDESKIQVDHNT
ncbi:uncharacterized protein LOC118736306 [Rhagoletis pomonella]|uniref:uncharacterized protein LOC118736305 n=1 Tax=Rhagoletis pomonella TaxID=28610 RepID=UPI0017841BD0|nr:uncharacterized protein LOC118736305 [Rhagoletis pomonella]XP_036322296.1 uncharacterized protein LOC118736306 [Rhagoletis pomonella]